MISLNRKRKLSRATKDENDSVAAAGAPVKKQKSTDEENAEDGSPSLGKTLLFGIAWLVDVTTKNYFVESAMSALKLSTHQNGRTKQRSKSKYENQINEEENKELSGRTARYDLKRTPLRESYRKSQNYITLPSPSLNERKVSNNFNIRNMGSRNPNGSSNPMLEKRKVIENPFKCSQKFRKADFQQTDNMYPGRKIENNKTDHSDPPLVSAMKINTSFVANSVTAAPARGSDGSRSVMDAPSTFLQHRVVGSVLYKNKGRTTEEVLALQERDQYKMLLDQFTKCCVRQTSGQKTPALQDKEVQTNLFGQLPPELPVQLKAFQKTLDPSASNFLAKYFKGRTCGISPSFPLTSKPLVTPKSVVSSKKTEKEDDVIIAEVKMPEPRLHQTSPGIAPFSAEWLDELKKTLDEDTEKKVELIRNQEMTIKQYRELRAQRLAAEDKALEELRVSGTALPEAEVDTSKEFPELTPKMNEIIDDALTPVPPDEVLCIGFNISISRKDIETLAGLNWLNDEIINFYMNLLIERSEKEQYPSVYVFNTFFYPKLMSGGHTALRRWTRKVDIFSFDMILVPVHMGMHWCLAVIDFRHKKIRYYDSMGGQNTECLHALRDYLKEERLDKKTESYDMSGWQYENVKKIPHQMNGSDCGMFTLKYAEYITRDAKITFTQDHMQYFRRRMVYEILMKQLL